MSRWEQFCVVGIGGHARTKLIPAIEANRQRVAGLVSRQAPETLPGARVFARIEDALAALPADTVFVIALPPSHHFEQALQTVKAGRDVIVEKPAFMSVAQAEAIARQCQASGTVLVEAFMHRHSELYARLLAAWRADRSRIAGLDADFLIPAMPPGTFRHSGDDEVTILWDMGCYVVTLLRDLGLPLERLEFVGREAGALVLGGTLDGVAFRARIGMDPDYRNTVSLRLDDGSTRRFRPFFYGRPGDRLIESAAEGVATAETLAEGNAFEAMFAVPREHWLKTQAERFEAILAVTGTLERLGAGLSS